MFIDVSMLEAAMATMGWAVSNYLVAGREPKPMGNENVTASPSGTFRTGDGLLNIAANKQEQFEAVCRVVGRPEWIRRSALRRAPARLQHRAELKSHRSRRRWPPVHRAVVAALQRRRRAGRPGLQRAAGAGAPAGRERGMVATFTDVPGVGRDIRVVRTGFKLNGEAPASRLAAADAGSSTPTKSWRAWLLGYGSRSAQEEKAI